VNGVCGLCTSKLADGHSLLTMRGTHKTVRSRLDSVPLCRGCGEQLDKLIRRTWGHRPFRRPE
jgi:hypothetical protein